MPGPAAAQGGAPQALPGKPVDRLAPARDIGERGITVTTRELGGLASATLRPSNDWGTDYNGFAPSLRLNADPDANPAVRSLAVSLLPEELGDGRLRSASAEGVVHAGRGLGSDQIASGCTSEKICLVYERKNHAPLVTAIETAGEVDDHVELVAGDLLGTGALQLAVVTVQSLTSTSIATIKRGTLHVDVLAIDDGASGPAWRHVARSSFDAVVDTDDAPRSDFAAAAGKLVDDGGAPAHGADGVARIRRDQLVVYHQQEDGSGGSWPRLLVLEMSETGLTTLDDELASSYGAPDTSGGTSATPTPQKRPVAIATPLTRREVPRLGHAAYTDHDDVILVFGAAANAGPAILVNANIRTRAKMPEHGLSPRLVLQLNQQLWGATDALRVADLDVDGDGLGEVVLAGASGCKVGLAYVRGVAGDFYEDRPRWSGTYTASAGTREFAIPDAGSECSGPSVSDLVLADTRTHAAQAAAGAMLPAAGNPTNATPRLYLAQHYTATPDDLSQPAEARTYVHGFSFRFDWDTVYLWPDEGRDLERIVSIAGPAFDGRTRLGLPRFRRTVRQEPLVVLNASPTHFDVFGDKTFDPHFCWGDNLFAVPEVCFFKTTYKRTQEAAREVTATVNEDWGVDAKVEASGDVGVVSITGTMEGRYGQKYSKEAGTQATEAISVAATAKNVDQAYTLTKVYDSLEYPVYSKGDDPASTADDAHLLHVSPVVTKRQWIDITGPLSTLRNTHQPGNLLSYARPEDVAEIPFIAAGTSAFGEEEFQITPTSDFTYTLNRERIEQSSASSSFSWGVSVGLEVDIDFIASPNIEVNGRYDTEQIRTATTNVGEKSEIEARLAQLDGSLGQLSYLVKPFAYYTDEGALVIDYAVEPDRNPNGVDTFWDRFYGTKPDPTMILPHYQEAERFGDRALTTDALQFETRDVEFLQRAGTECEYSAEGRFQPAVGDDLCLKLTARNFSLEGLGSGSRVRWFAGDPDAGGVEIVPGGQALDAIAARGRRELLDAWKVPAEYAGQRVRVFAKLDADGSVREVHEDNNKGFNVLHVEDPEPTATGLFAPRRVVAEQIDDTTALVEWRTPDNATLPETATFVVRGYLDGDPTAVIERTLDPADAELVRDARFEMTITGISEPGRYRFAVFTASGDAVGPVSDPSEPLALAQTLPTTPTDLGITGTATQSLVWSAPSWSGVGDDGAPTPITGYVVIFHPVGGGDDVVRTVDATPTRLDLRGLACGGAYDVTIAALTAQGRGPDSEPLRFTFSGPPSAPTKVLASGAANGSATVSWSAPAELCGAKLTGYEVTAQPGGEVQRTNASTTNATFTGLPLGSSVTFVVAALSDKGASAPSPASNAVLVARAPGAPANARSMAGPGRATVAWQPPADAGGAAVIGYVVELTAEGASQSLVKGVDASARSVTFDELVNGRRHTWSVRAVNVAGTGGAATGSVLPLDRPSAPTVVTARGGDASATVDWRAPDADGGNPITQYVVTAAPGGHSVTVDATARTAVVGGLTNGGRYRFTVAAVSAQGRGAESAPSDEVLAARAPDAPRSIVVDPGVLRLHVRWDAPASDGGSPITAYRVAAQVNGRTRVVTVDGRARSATIDGLILLLPHVVTVHAVNDRGDGPVAQAGSTFTPLPVPPAPVVVVSATVSTGLLGDATTLIDGSVSLTLRSGSGTGAAKVTSWDSRVRWAGADGGWSDWLEPDRWQRSGNPKRTARLAAGTTACFTARGRTADGDLTAWSKEQCLSRALSHRSLARRGWKLTTGPASAVSIVTAGCRRCGALQVRLGGRHVKTVRLAGAGRVVRVALPHHRGGTLTFRRPGGGRVTGVKAVAVQRVVDQARAEPVSRRFGRPSVR